MGTPLLSDKILRETVAIYEQALKDGARPVNQFGPGRSAARLAGERAVESGFVQSINAFETRLRVAIDRGIIPDESVYRPARYQQPMPRTVIQHAPPDEIAAHLPDGDITRVLVIPDLHHDPRHPDRYEVMKWIARFGASRNIPRVVQLGDWLTMDSVSRHDRNETYAGRLKPTIKQDLECLVTSLRTFREAQGDWKPKLDCTLGNHEYRLWAWENANPESYGMFTGEMLNAFGSYGWRTTPFGEIKYIDGVAYTHAPINGVGRAMGGKTASHRSGALMTVPLVHGHTHALEIYRDKKHGPVSHVAIIQAGCALPWGTIEQYALHGPGGWWYGVLVLTVQGGEITDYEAVSMLTLERDFGDKLAA